MNKFDFQDVSLVHDCENCAALCCVSLAFDRSDMFAIDKPAGHPCPNLAQDGLCKIHRDLDRKGFAGCIQYGCLGAGQRVTQDVFDGQSWQNDETLLPAMLKAFVTMRQVHEMLQMLEMTAKLSLHTTQQAKADDFLSLLHPDDGWTAQTLDSFAQSTIAKDFRHFLESLRENISTEQRQNRKLD